MGEGQRFPIRSHRWWWWLGLGRRDRAAVSSWEKGRRDFNLDSAPWVPPEAARAGLERVEQGF